MDNKKNITIIEEDWNIIENINTEENEYNTDTQIIENKIQDKDSMGEFEYNEDEMFEGLLISVWAGL